MANGIDSGTAASLELARLDKEISERSILRKAIDYVTEPYHQETAARQKLLEAAVGGETLPPRLKPAGTPARLNWMHTASLPAQLRRLAPLPVGNSALLPPARHTRLMKFVRATVTNGWMAPSVSPKA